MRVGFIGDIVGRPGRKIIKEYLPFIKEEYGIDYVIANGENASHGFGMTVKNCDELLKSGIDLITGGNHSFDKKKDMLVLLENSPVLRPDNYAKGVPGRGIEIIEIGDENLAVLNLMGLYGMPQVDNPFNHAIEVVDKLHQDGIKNILVDFHAEATSEKRAMMMMFKGRVSAIIGTHTHVATDDLQIFEDTGYITDMGLTGCRDNVIGMDAKVPIEKFTTGIGGHFNVPNSCKAILQMGIFDISHGKCTNAFKIKKLCDKEEMIVTKAMID